MVMVILNVRHFLTYDVTDGPIKFGRKDRRLK